MAITIDDETNESYIYVCGISPAREIRISPNVVLRPVNSNPDPDDMIACVMKYGRGSEFELGLLIATLRYVAAELMITADNAEDLLVETWNAQSVCVLIAAIMNCETMWYFNSNCSVEEFNAHSKVSCILPNLYKLPSQTVELDEKACHYIEQHITKALELDEDDRFRNASNALWGYRFHFRPAVQLSIIWGGIESLFMIERGIKTKLSKAASRFLSGTDNKEESIKKLYEGRCKAIHELKNGEEDVFNESVKLLHQLVVKCVEINTLPDVERLLIEESC